LPDYVNDKTRQVVGRQSFAQADGQLEGRFVVDGREFSAYTPSLSPWQKRLSTIPSGEVSKTLIERYGHVKIATKNSTGGPYLTYNQNHRWVGQTLVDCAVISTFGDWA
jgi:hypothetical protein